LSSCTPYNGQLYSHGTVTNEGTFVANSTTNTLAQSGPAFNGLDTTNTTNNNVVTNTSFTSSNSNTIIDVGVQALFDCTRELGYTAGFTASDYSNCLQLTQATLTDYALNLLKDYILTWADFAIDTALQALGFSNGRSYVSSQVKSSQLTSIIGTGYRWYN